MKDIHSTPHSPLHTLLLILPPEVTNIIVRYLYINCDLCCIAVRASTCQVGRCRTCTLVGGALIRSLRYCQKIQSMHPCF